jgi:hypothetical protein
MSNVRRIQRYLQAKAKPEKVQAVAPGEENRTQEQARGSFLTFARTILPALCGPDRQKLLAVGC